MSIYKYIYIFAKYKRKFFGKWGPHIQVEPPLSYSLYPIQTPVPQLQRGWVTTTLLQYCSIARHTQKSPLGNSSIPSLYNSDWGKGIRHWQMIYIRVLLISSINVYGWIIHVSFCKANVSLGLSLYLGFILCWFFFLLLLSLSLCRLSHSFKGSKKV